MTHLLTAALTWDPQIRGFLIFITAFVILPGSTYLLLATNTGAKVGFLLAVAGLSGWLMVMAFVWMVYGIGMKGRIANWHVEDVVTGQIQSSTVDAASGGLQKWERLQPGNAILGDAQAAADHVLVAPKITGGHGEAAAPREFENVFEETPDYVFVAGYRTGGEDYFLPGGAWENPKGILHKPHHVVIEVAPTLEVETPLGGVPRKPVPDPAQAHTYVVMVRDLGSLRLPPFVIGISSGIIFLITVSSLHRRDKEIMRLRAQPAPVTA